MMRQPNKNKMAGVNSCFASASELEILKIQEDAAVPENTKRATKFGMKDFRVKRRLIILQTSVLPFITLDALYRLHVFHAWIEKSIKSIFKGFLLKMLLRSLPVYILKQLFFSISVNSGNRGSVNILPLFTSISKNNC